MGVLVMSMCKTHRAMIICVILGITVASLGAAANAPDHVVPEQPSAKVEAIETQSKSPKNVVPEQPSAKVEGTELEDSGFFPGFPGGFSPFNPMTWPHVKVQGINKIPCPVLRALVGSGF